MLRKPLYIYLKHMQNNKNITVKLSQLVGWADNPRDITDESLEALKKQMVELGVYKPLMVVDLEMVAHLENGTVHDMYEVIGGNMRLRALQDLKVKEVQVKVVHPKDESEKVAFALMDNDQIGTYEEEALAELLFDNPDFPIQDFHIDGGSMTTLEFFQDQMTNERVDTSTDVDTTDEKFEAYENNPIKQIVLYFPPQEFKEVEAQFEHLQAEFKVDTNAEVVIELLNKYEKN